MSRHSNNNRTPAARPSVANAPRVQGAQKNTSSAETLVSRRRFLYGAIGVGAIAAVGIGAAAYSSASGGTNDEIACLDAPASALSTLADLEALDNEAGSLELMGEFDLPYGTLVWANGDKVAACLLPTEQGSPLAQVGLLFLGSGSMTTVLKRAVGTSDSFEIYDVRANENGIVWTEANILQELWRVYAAPLDDGVLGSPKLLEEGDASYDTPALCVAGDRAFWLANPKDPRESGLSARLMSATFGSEDNTCVIESTRRMGTPPYGDSDSVTIAVREDSSSVYYQLVNLDARTGEVLDKLTLPHAVAPIEGGYGHTGFMFSFPDIYDYEGAIANLGTYAPYSLPTDGNYNTVRWFDFARTPTAAPAWCDDLLIVKSTYAVCGVDLNEGTYFAIDVENGADTYGEYLASTGTHDTFVTYTNIDHTPIGEKSIHACRVKVWKTLPAEERKAWRDAQAEAGDDAVQA